MRTYRYIGRRSLCQQSPNFFCWTLPPIGSLQILALSHPKKKKKMGQTFCFQTWATAKTTARIKNNICTIFTFIFYIHFTPPFNQNVFCQSLFELCPLLPPCNGAAPPILGTSALCLHTLIIYFGPSSRGTINEDVCLSVDALIKSGTF